MDFQVLSNLREAVRGAVRAAYPEQPIYTAELTSIVDEEDCNVSEFFTVFFSEGDETQDGESLDSDTYRTDAQITVGYFNSAAAANQSWLDNEAGTIRNAVMNLNSIAAYQDNITRAGWQYIPPIDGAIAGIYFRFDFSFSN